MTKRILLLLFIFSGAIAFGQTLVEEDNIAKQYYDMGDYVKATVMFENLYDKAPNAHRYQMLFSCYMRTESWDKADKLCKSHYKKFGLPDTYVDWGDLYLKQGNEKEATKKFDEALNVLPEKKQQVFAVAQAFYRIGQMDYALATYQLGRKLNPGQMYNFQVADIYGQLGQVDMMFKEYLDMLEIAPNYITSVKNALSRSVSSDPEFQNNKILKTELISRVQGSSNEAYSELLIWLYIQEKSFAAAFRQVKAMDKRVNGDQRMIYELAETCEKNNDFEVALECYNYIITIGKKSPYYLDAKVAVLHVLQMKVIATNKYTQEDLLLLKAEYEKTLAEIDGTAYSTRLRKDLAHLEAFYLRNSAAAIEILEVAINSGYARRQDVAMCKIELADILILEDDIWEAALLYGQVEKEFKEDVIGQQAKFKRAKISYYVGEFSWAQAQLDVLKTSTSKLIANDAMALSLLIQDNMALDTTVTPLLMYARADLFVYQLRFDEAMKVLDSLESDFGWHGIIDESIFLRAKVHVSRRDFATAAAAYQRIVDNYSWELTGDDAYYELGKLYEEYLGDKAKAMEMYEALMLNFPGSIYVVDARKRYRALRGDKMEDT